MVILTKATANTSVEEMDPAALEPLNYILITFAMFSCGRGNIFLSANLTKPLVMVMPLLRNNPH